MEAPPCHCPRSFSLSWLTLEGQHGLGVGPGETVLLERPPLLLSRKDTHIIKGWQIANEGNLQTRRHTGFWNELPPFAKPVWHKK